MTVKHEVVNATADDARRWIRYIHEQRSLRPQYVHLLAQSMIRGEWRLSNDCITFESAPGRTGCRLLNGQHRAYAVIEADETVPGITVPLVVGTGYAPDSGSVLDVGKMRTLADTLDFIHGTEQPGHRDIAAATLHCWHLDAGTWKDRQPTPTRMQLVDFLKNEPGIPECTVIGQKMQRELKGGVAGYAGAIWLMHNGHHVGRIDDFVTAVAYGEQLSRNDPAYVLNRALQRAFSNRRAGNPDHRRGWWYTAMIVKAWNNHIDGKRQTELIFSRADNMPTAQ